MSKEIAEAADRLWKTFQNKGTCRPVHDLIGKHDLEIAYKVQEEITKLREMSGAKIVGRKVGFTSTVLQKQLGISQPGYGILFDDMDRSLGHVFTSVPQFYNQQPRVEAEIAFVLDRDIAFEKPITSQIIDAIAYVVPALEIVLSRIKEPDIQNLSTANIIDIIADNASGGYFVLGHRPRLLREVDVVNCKMTMVKKTIQEEKVISENVSEGTGVRCYGSPLNALRWLAEEMVRVGRPLQAGDVVMSGALGPMASAYMGGLFEGTIDGLGSVSVSFPQP